MLVHVDYYVQHFGNKVLLASPVPSQGRYHMTASSKTVLVLFRT